MGDFIVTGQDFNYSALTNFNLCTDYDKTVSDVIEFNKLVDLIANKYYKDLSPAQEKKAKELLIAKIKTYPSANKSVKDTLAGARTGTLQCAFSDQVLVPQKFKSKFVVRESDIKTAKEQAIKEVPGQTCSNVPPVIKTPNKKVEFDPSQQNTITLSVYVDPNRDISKNPTVSQIRAFPLTPGTYYLEYEGACGSTIKGQAENIGVSEANAKTPISLTNQLTIPKGATPNGKVIVYRESQRALPTGTPGPKQRTELKSFALADLVEPKEVEKKPGSNGGGGGGGEPKITRLRTSPRYLIAGPKGNLGRKIAFYFSGKNLPATATIQISDGDGEVQQFSGQKSGKKITGKVSLSKDLDVGKYTVRIFKGLNNVEPDNMIGQLSFNINKYVPPKEETPSGGGKSGEEEDICKINPSLCM